MQTQSTTTLSTQDTTNLVREVYNCFFKGDIDGLLDHYTSDIDWEVFGPSNLPTGGPHKGKDQVRAFFGKVNDLLESEKFDVQHYVAQGDTVVALGHYQWTSKVTQRKIDAHFAHVMTFRGDKICRFREYTDTAAALAGMIN